MPPRKGTAATATYGDHEVITPENKLPEAVSVRPLFPGEEDPLVRAEKALSELSPVFSSWMDSECERLDRGPAQRRQERFHQIQQGSAVPRRP
jgi:hypothetical protein